MTLVLPESLTVRALADAKDREAWLRARSTPPRIGGSDAANYSKLESVPSYIRQKLTDGFDGNAYTRHGNDREPHMLRAYGFEQNTIMFRAIPTSRHVATPDGIMVRPDGSLVLAQCKALDHDPRTRNGLPPKYLRQCWWEQHVLGAARTLFIWEVHRDYRPIDFEPESIWIDRDDTEIAKLVTISNAVLRGVDAAADFTRQLTEHPERNPR